MANEKDKKDNQSAPEDDEKDEGDGDAEKKETKDKTKNKKLVRVVFNKSFTPYVQGEMAGLEPEMAEKLIEDKICSKA